jgi:hypothetical protein
MAGQQILRPENPAEADPELAMEDVLYAQKLFQATSAEVLPKDQESSSQPN